MSAHNFRLGLIFLLLCRCTLDPSTENPYNKTPPRLSSKTYYGEDGSVLGKAETFDSKLKVPCSVLLAQDGKLRCLPRTDVVVLYPDPDCAQAPFAARLRSCAAPPSYALSPIFNTSCALGPVLTRWSAFFVGAAISTPSTAYAADTGACVSINTEAYDFFLALSVQPTDFVAVTPG